MNISVIGTGIMGKALATRLLQTGHQVKAYNRSPEKLVPLKKTGAFVSCDIKEAIAGSDYILLMLKDSHAIVKTLFDKSSLDLKGKIIIQMGTISSAQSKKLLSLAQKRGAYYLECPVLGSKKETLEGRLILMAAGKLKLFNRLKKFLQNIGPHPVYVGKVGTAAILKLSMNHLIASHIAAFSLSLGLVRKNGIKTDLFMDILRKSSLYAPMFDKKLSMLLSGDFTHPNFPAKHLLKDIDLVLKEVHDCRMDDTALQGLRRLYYKGLKAGIGELDYSAIDKIVC